MVEIEEEDDEVDEMIVRKQRLAKSARYISHAFYTQVVGWLVHCFNGMHSVRARGWGWGNGLILVSILAFDRKVIGT